jgi:hypothetical protein
MFFQCPIFTFGQTTSSDMVKPLQRNMYIKQADLVCSQIKNESFPLEQILREIKKLESLTNGDTLLPIGIMRDVVAALVFRFGCEYEKATELAQEIIAQYAFLPLDESLNILQRCETLYNRSCDSESVALVCQRIWRGSCQNRV